MPTTHVNHFRDLRWRPRATSFLPTSVPSFVSSRLGHPRYRKVRARTPQTTSRSLKTPGSLQINLLFTMYAEQASGSKPMQTFTSSKDNFRCTHQYRPEARRRSPLDMIVGRRPVQSAAPKARQRQDKTMVELSGIEPLTPCLQSRCSPS